MRDDHGITSARNITAGVGRRDFLRLGAYGTLAAGGAGLLAACGSSSGSTTTTQSAGGGGKPKRGGTLSFALGSGGSADGLNPLAPGLPTDYARIPQIFEPLAIWDDNLNPVPLLAESIEPNTDGSVWTVRLRKGITFHNGKPLTADDVIYTFQQILNPKDPGYGALAMQMVDYKNLKKVDTYTVQFPCHGPFSMFLKTLPVYEYYIVPVGWKAGQTVGTGPFVMDSFVAGQASTMSRNKNYWQSGLPYVDKVVMTDYTEESSRVNALISGQVNCIDQLSAPSIAQLKSANMQLNISSGGGFCPFTMRVDQAPFNNPDVREALKLCVDRPAIRTAVYGGYGAIGNDVFAYWDPDYDHALPQREQDISKAKYLLKKAGHESLTLTLVVAAQAQGWLSEAELFQQQAATAGVKINLNQMTTTDFNNGYTKWTFANSFWYSNPYLNEVALATDGAGSPFNETHFNDPHYESLYTQAIGTLDESRQRELIHEMQTIDYNTSGYIIPAFLPVIDGLSPKVHGDGPSKSGTAFNNWDLRRFWVD
jgi:peptide/nickel transport system substrate-binding protein